MGVGGTTRTTLTLTLHGVGITLTLTLDHPHPHPSPGQGTLTLTLRISPFVPVGLAPWARAGAHSRLASVVVESRVEAAKATSVPRSSSRGRGRHRGRRVRRCLGCAAGSSATLSRSMGGASPVRAGSGVARAAVRSVRGRLDAPSPSHERSRRGRRQDRLGAKPRCYPASPATRYERGRCGNAVSRRARRYRLVRPTGVERRG